MIMAKPKTTTSSEGRNLILTRLVSATPDKIFYAWTVPALLEQWFAPLPWTTSKVETDVRIGSSSLIVMRSPDGQEFAGHGVYLEVVKNQRLLFTDAFTKAWAPSDKAFIVVVLTFEAQGEKKPRTPRECSTGALPAVKRTKRWASTQVG